MQLTPDKMASQMIAMCSKILGVLLKDMQMQADLSFIEGKRHTFVTLHIGFGKYFHLWHKIRVGLAHICLCVVL